METIFQQTISSTYTRSAKQTSFLTRFIEWSQSQEKNRLGWLAAAIAVHGCILTPLAMFAIMMSGNNIIFLSIAIGAMAMTLVVNLAALSTKITIPTFLFSIIIDLIVIINCIALGF